MTQVVVVVDKTQELVEVLDEHAIKDDVFPLEEPLTRTTIDIISKVVIDHDFNSLNTKNPFVELPRNQIGWFPDQNPIDPFPIWNPLRPIILRKNTYQLNKYLGQVFDARYSTADAAPKSQKRKAGIDLALETYLKGKAPQTLSSSPIHEHKLPPLCHR